MPSKNDKDVISNPEHPNSKIEQDAPSNEKSSTAVTPRIGEQPYSLNDDGEDENVVLGYN